jgi:hypothetical protein
LQTAKKKEAISNESRSMIGSKSYLKIVARTTEMLTGTYNNITRLRL